MQYNFLSQQDYYDQRFDLLKKVEGVVLPAYVDSKGIPTIGIGFNLRTHLNAVLRQFVNMDKLSADDAKIVEKIRGVVQKTYTPGDHTSLRNAIAPLFKSLSSNHRSTFSFNDDNEVKTFLNDVVAPQYESQLNTWLTQNLPDLAYCSKERIALFSLAYNSMDLLGNNLKDALLHSNRLQAWFEIRYKSNGDRINANRRYAESDMFGLWDRPTPTQMELNAFASFLDQNDPYGSSTSSLQSIRNYEADYNPHARKDINSNRIDETINTVAVKNYFVALYSRGMSIDGNVILGTQLNNNVIASSRTLTKREIQKGYLKSTSKSDLILGGKGKDKIDGDTGNDVIYGGAGNDTLTGGKGDDYLIGGADFDTYYYTVGDGHDWIYDQDNTGKIIIKDQRGGIVAERSLGNFYKVEGGTNAWKNPNGVIEITHNSPWKIVLDDGGTIELGEDFESGDFGITLLDTPSDPVTNSTITGDFNPANLNDTLYDSVGNDRIEGKDGSDMLYGWQGGNDWFSGGSGRDGLSSGEGDDIIEGGTEGDLLFGAEGDDQLFGETKGEMEDLITAGETAPSINEQGDLISGGAGDDLLYGSVRNDALFGGAGSDLLVGSPTLMAA